jgi:hypothetical protein
MKTFILSMLAIAAFNSFSQTVTTTTINGSLKVNDSLNVSNNLEAADITSRGEMVAQNNLRTESDLIVIGNADISGSIKVTGISKLSGGVLTPSLAIGNATDNFGLSLQTLASGAKVFGIGFAGPINELPTTCIAPYNSSSLSIFNSRAGVIKSGSSNMLDFNNDGSNGFIDYGYDINIYAFPSANPIPALKINSHCYGDVEIARGGGFVATGTNLEVGSPVRFGGIALNVNAPNKIGQRITVSQQLPDSYSPFPDCYNTQLFVNRNNIKALTVLNTVTNASGDQTFVVYGSGKTHIGKGRPQISGPVANAMLTVDGLVIAKEIKVTVSSAYWADYVFDKTYRLLPLKDVRSFIDEHGHLPNVPSTEEMTTTGNDLGKTDAVLLAKIEECMLYIMELDKKVNDLQKENQELKKKSVNHKSN